MGFRDVHNKLSNDVFKAKTLISKKAGKQHWLIMKLVSLVVGIWMLND